MDRVELVRSNARDPASGCSPRTTSSYDDDNFTFDGRDDRAEAGRRPVPFWYCGATPRVGPPRRRVLRRLDAGTDLDAGDDRKPGSRTMRELSAEQGDGDADDRRSSRRRRSRRPDDEALRATSTSRACSPGRTRRSSRSSRRPAASRRSRTSRAQLIAGSPDEVVDEVEKFETGGVEHLVFDFRFKFDRWFERSNSSATTSSRGSADDGHGIRPGRGLRVHRARPRAAGRDLPRARQHLRSVRARAAGGRTP